MRHVIAVCQSNKKARTRVAKVLDRYLWRVGQFTWRGRASSACLHRMAEDLRKGASRATAVAVHEMKDSSMYRDPLFMVGSKAAFGPRGIVPLSVRSRPDSDSFSPGEKRARATLLIAAFAHDIGKAGVIFQRKMDESHGNAKVRIGDPVRHDLISAAVWDAMFGDCDDVAFATKLSAVRSADFDTGWVSAARGLCDIYNGSGKSPLSFRFLRRPGLVQEIGLLILGHHRLAGSKQRAESLLNGEQHINLKASKPSSSDFVVAPGRPFWHDERLMAGLRVLAEDLRHPSSGMTDFTLRTCLMIADHIGSSEREINQTRPEHVANLIDGAWADDLLTHTRKVMSWSRATFRGLIGQRHSWPALSRDDCPRPLLDFSRATGRFAWQADAAREAARTAAAGGGFFGCVLAGTGTGKTRGVPAILAAAAFADPDPSRQRLRFSLGLGLRTLASQSARSYVEDLGFARRDVRFVVGSPILESGDQVVSGGEDPEGSESSRNMVTDLEVLEPIGSEPDSGTAPPRSYFVEDAPPALMAKLGDGHDMKGLTSPPVLICTLDQLASSASPLKSGHLMSSVRIMTCDLLIDEVDQFSAEDLTVIYRLIRQSAASGKRVILASATLPRDVAVNAFAAYRAGWEDYSAFSGAPANVASLFVGDQPGSCQGERDCQDAGTLYDACAAAQAAAAPPRISGVVDMASYGDIPAEKWDATISAIGASCDQGHQINGVEISGIKVSAGFVRLAKVRHVAAATKALSRMAPPPGVLRKLVCLHSRMTEGGRSLIENELRLALNRKGAEPDRGLETLLARRGVFDEARKLGVRDISLVVVCSSVIETGNDLDFDYGVLDPTDARSLVQAAGRVRRHRAGPPAGQNVFVLPVPLVVLESGRLAYPGIETPVSQEATGVTPPVLGDARNSAHTLLGDLVHDVSARFILNNPGGVCLSADKEVELREAFVKRGVVASLTDFLGSSVTRSGSGRLLSRRFRRRTQAECQIHQDASGVWVVPASRTGAEHAVGRARGEDAPSCGLISCPVDESLATFPDVPLSRITRARLALPEDTIRTGSAKVRMSQFFGAITGNQDLDEPFGIVSKT